MKGDKMETQSFIGLVRAFFIGAIGAFIIWILSGSSASIGFGVLLFYLEATRKNDDAQKPKGFWQRH